eukprot:PhM_4_TR15090/c0_g1_i1/m.26397
MSWDKKNSVGVVFSDSDATVSRSDPGVGWAVLSHPTTVHHAQKVRIQNWGVGQCTLALAPPSPVIEDLTTWQYAIGWSNTTDQWAEDLFGLRRGYLEVLQDVSSNTVSVSFIDDARTPAGTFTLHGIPPEYNICLHMTDGWTCKIVEQEMIHVDPSNITWDPTHSVGVNISKDGTVVTRDGLGVGWAVVSAPTSPDTTQRIQIQNWGVGQCTLALAPPSPVIEDLTTWQYAIGWSNTTDQWAEDLFGLRRGCLTLEYNAAKGFLKASFLDDSQQDAGTISFGGIPDSYRLCLQLTDIWTCKIVSGTSHNE